MAEWDSPELGSDDVEMSTGCAYGCLGAVVAVVVLGASILLRLFFG